MSKEELEQKGFIYLNKIKPLYVNAPYHMKCIREFFKYIDDEEFKNIDVYQFTNPELCLHVDMIICRNKFYYSIHTYWRQMKHIGSFISDEIINSCLNN